MTNTTDSKPKNNNNITHVINPTGTPQKMIVTGEVPAWGFKGEIEIEHSQNNNIFKLSTLRYRFGKISRTRNPNFSITAPNQSVLSITPYK